MKKPSVCCLDKTGISPSSSQKNTGKGILHGLQDWETPWSVFVLGPERGWAQAEPRTFLSIFTKLFFPFLRAHIWQRCGANSSSWLSVHVFCIPWHHALLSLPKSRLCSTDHQNRAPASLWGTGLTSSPKSFPLAKSRSVFHLLCCTLSHSHPLLKNSFQIILKLLLFYPACKDLFFAQGCNYSVTSQQNNPFSLYSQWVFNSLTTWKLGNLYFPQNLRFVFLCYG